jgi:UDP-N-acetylglucosamine transferase subunit ALG13
MILVTTGTNEQPFDRLVRAARDLSTQFPAFVQYGSSREPNGAGEWVEFLSFDELAAAMRRSDVVIAHAGVGSILLALRCGHRPIVVPRLVGLNEAVDDHQLHFARRLDGGSMLRLVEDEAELGAVVQEELRTRVRLDLSVGDGRRREPSRLAAELRDYLHDLATPRAAA